jgi:predicted ribosomally synthesized peptide with SipW-like signal peptide
MKKIFAIALCVAMLAIVLVSGTMAYFTDTQEKTNTFTMGKVDIELTEPSYVPGDDGKLKVFPGQTYPKDPTITVASDSENCYLVATVTISQRSNLHKLYANDTTGVKQDWGLSLAGKGGLVSGGIAAYTAVGAEENGTFGTLLGEKVFLTYAEDSVADTITYTFYFKDIHKAGDKEVLFTDVAIPTIIDNGDLDGDLNITVNAYAIQAVGFSNVYEAYAAYTAQE